MTELNKRPVVWVVNDKGGYDFRGAEAHGEIRVVFKGDFNPFDLPGARRHVEELLKDSAPHDWVLPVGNGVAGMIVATTFVALHDKLPLLVYHAQRKDYVKRELADFHRPLPS